MEAAPEFKNESQEKLALLATLQGQEIEKQSQEIARLRTHLQEIDGGFQGAFLDASPKKAEVPLEPFKSKRKSKIKTQKKGHGPTEQTRLEHVEEVFHLDAPDQICPSCGGDLEEWEGQFEGADLIDVVEKIYLVKKVKRQKYRCNGKDCSHIETALGPDKVIKGGRYSVNFAVDVASEKYTNHMPLERQTRAMKRLGLKVKSQTLWDQTHALAKHLEPSYDALHAHILEKNVVGIDTTSWPKLMKKKPGTKPWQMWCLTSDDGIYHSIRHDKGTKTCNEILKNYRGVVIGDQAQTHYAAQKMAAREGPGFKFAGCWAHVYRRFREAGKDFPSEATPVLEMISGLYKARSENEKRDAEDIIGKLFSYLLSLARRPKSTLQSAINYTLNAKASLILFLLDDEIWLDNNLTERSLRGPVIGRKNHYGSKSVEGTKVAAIFYSLVETAKHIGVNPTDYLKETARRAIANPGRVFLPHEMLV